MELSVVLPCYNEAANIERTALDVIQWCNAEQIDGEVIIVNDGSKDDSKKILQGLAEDYKNVVALHHSENKGYGAAICTGCDAATKKHIAFMDSDGQFKAEDLGKLIPHLEHYEFVAGVRSKRADPFMRSLNAWCYSILVRVALGIRVKDLNCGMKMFTKAIWPSIRPTRATGALFNAEVFVRLQELHIPFAEQEVQHYPRTAGSPTGANLMVILKMFQELRSLKKSTKY